MNLIPRYCIGLLLACPLAAYATPPNGFGAYVGVISARENTVQSSGLSLGGDALFAINDDWSFNPYLMVSWENDNYSRHITDDLAGLHLRRWFGDWFAGVQFFVHSRAIIANNAVQETGYGYAGGLVGGVEYANGWGAEVQTDSFEGTGIKGVRRNAVRLNLTYRWH